MNHKMLLCKRTRFVNNILLTIYIHYITTRKKNLIRFRFKLERTGNRNLFKFVFIYIFPSFIAYFVDKSDVPKSTRSVLGKDKVRIFQKK